MKSKFKLDVWGYITIALLGAYAIFLLYPMLNLLRRSVYSPDGVFTLGYFSTVSYTHLTLPTKA